MSENIKPVAWAYDRPAPFGGYTGNLSFDRPSPVGNVHVTPLYDKAAIEAARQEGFSNGYESGSRSEYKLARENEDLRRQLAAAQAWKQEAAGCFQAANDEGLQDRLMESGFSYGDGSLADLVARRLISACPPVCDDTAALDTLLAAKERETIERCAKVCEDHPEGLNMMGRYFVICANAIRALLNKEPT